MGSRNVSPTAYWRLLSGNHNFRRLWFAQIVSELGDWIYVVAVYSRLLELTGRAESIALAAVLQTLPQIFAAPISGILNDRLSRKRIMISADLVRAVIVLLMLVATRAGHIWLIYTLIVLETAMWAFFEPGRSAVVPNITGKDDLVVANTLSSVTWSVNFALGSGLGGFIGAYFGLNAVFIINSGSFLLSAWFLRGMRFEESHVQRKPLRARDLIDFSPVTEGLRYVFSDRRLISLVMAKGGLGFLGANWVILPIFGERIFPVMGGGLDAARGAVLGMSALMSARGVGALIGPYVTAHWTGQDQRRQRLGILAGFGLGALGYVALAFAPAMWAAVLAVVVAHAGGSMVWVFSTTLLQAHAADRYRGRVFSADFAFLVLGMSATSYAAGQLIDHSIDVRVVAAGVGCLAALAAAGWAARIRDWPATDEAKTSASI
ncbi:MAG TPA: MFS transporter [Bryobacteraceae bacterium]|nr:MFS transporter [Bryobacteraceae bacterium]